MLQRNKISLSWPASGCRQRAGRWQFHALPDLERLALESSRSMMAAREQARLRVAMAVRVVPALFPIRKSNTWLERCVRGRPAVIRAMRAAQLTRLSTCLGAWGAYRCCRGRGAGQRSRPAGFEADLLASIRLRYLKCCGVTRIANAREDLALMESVRSRIALRVEVGEAPFRIDQGRCGNDECPEVGSGGRVSRRAGAFLSAAERGADLQADYSLRGTLREVPELQPIEAVRQALPDGSPALARARAEVTRAEQQLELERRNAGPAWP